MDKLIFGFVILVISIVLISADFYFGIVGLVVGVIMCIKGITSINTKNKEEAILSEWNEFLDKNKAFFLENLLAGKSFKETTTELNKSYIPEGYIIRFFSKSFRQFIVGYTRNELLEEKHKKHINNFPRYIESFTRKYGITENQALGNLQFEQFIFFQDKIGRIHSNEDSPKNVGFVILTASHLFYVPYQQFQSYVKNQMLEQSVSMIMNQLSFVASGAIYSTANIYSHLEDSNVEPNSAALQNFMSSNFIDNEEAFAIEISQIRKLRVPMGLQERSQDKLIRIEAHNRTYQLYMATSTNLLLNQDIAQHLDFIDNLLEELLLLTAMYGLEVDSDQNHAGTVYLRSYY